MDSGWAYHGGIDLGAPELLIVVVAALLIFGPSQVPKLARALGEAAREFRYGSEIDSSAHREHRDVVDADQRLPPEDMPTVG